MSALYDRVALIGLGLIASSMAHGMRRAGLAGEIVGTARSAETRAIAHADGLCDRVTDTAAGNWADETDSGEVVRLSNNHVYALVDEA